MKKQFGLWMIVVLAALVVNACSPLQELASPRAPGKGPAISTLPVLHPTALVSPEIVPGSEGAVREMFLSTETPTSSLSRLLVPAISEPLTSPALVGQNGVPPLPGISAEKRLIELEWPTELYLGKSDLIRLDLVPFPDGYIVKAQLANNLVQSQTLHVVQSQGYTLTALARLDGVGFETQPIGDQRQYLVEGKTQTWYWTISPRTPGSQRLAVLVLLGWQPEAGNPGPENQVIVFSKGLDIQVISFLGLTYGQLAAGGYFFLVIGLGIGFFALFFRPSSPKEHIKPKKPNPALVVETIPGVQLNPDETSLLRALFHKYARVSLISESRSGYSGARTFLALPILAGGKSAAHTIVKIGSRTSIQREYQHYEDLARDSLPLVTTRIHHQPVTVHRSGKAALQYTFMPELGCLPSSLRLELLENPDPEWLYRIFNAFGPNWWMNHKPFVFRLEEEFDRLLSPHLVVQPIPPGETPYPEMDLANTAFMKQVTIGTALTIPRFPHQDKRQDGLSLNLSGWSAPGQPPLRVRWMSHTPPDHSSGRVIATRSSLMLAQTQGFDLFGLPDPLKKLEQHLGEMISGTHSIIHGNLNLENILVGSDGLVWLVDYSEMRIGHPMFDFARLAAEIIAHIISARIGSGRIYLEHLKNGDPLLKAVEDIAGKCLFNPTVTREYNLSLYVSCLGALKFPNLDQRQKHLLYLTAAFLGAEL